MRSYRGLCLALLICLLVGAAPAAAQTPPTLTGETLISFFEPSGPSPRVIDVDCDPSGVSTLTFTVQGSASGAYNGTFVETVTARIGDQSLLPPVPNGGPVSPFSYGLSTGPVVAFDAEFTISAFPGDPIYETVTGFKRVIAGAPLNTGFCFEVENSGEIPEFSTLVSGYSAAVRAQLTYEALIKTATGTFRDSGTAEAVAREGFVTDGSPDPVRAKVGFFGERFLSSGAVTQPVNLKPGLGCGDKNHVHVRENDCKFDPK